MIRPIYRQPRYYPTRNHLDFFSNRIGSCSEAFSQHKRKSERTTTLIALLRERSTDLWRKIEEGFESNRDFSQVYVAVQANY